MSRFPRRLRYALRDGWRGFRRDFGESWGGWIEGRDISWEQDDWEHGGASDYADADCPNEEDQSR